MACIHLSLRASTLLPLLLDWADESVGTNCHIYSIQHQKSHTVEIPKGLNRHGMGVLHGFMLLTWKNKARDSISLFNPFTRVTIDLPFEHGERYMFLEPVYIGRNPSRGNGELVMYIAVISLLNQVSRYVVIWQPHKNAWAKVEIPGVGPFVYFNGKIFAHNNESEKTTVVDVETGVFVSEIPLPNKALRSFVETSGELLGVVQVFRWWKNHWRFEIYRLEEIKEGSWRWVTLSGIGDLMLFLSEASGIAVRTSGIKGAKGNCIYAIVLHDETFVLVRYDLAEDRYEVLRPTHWKASWLIPVLY